MINKNNFLVRFSLPDFDKYVKPYIKSRGTNWGWNGSDPSYYGYENGQPVCTSFGTESIKISVDEFRRIILGQNIEPQYEIY